MEAVDDANLPIIAQYQDATKTQQAALRGAQMNVAIDAKLPRLEKQGKLDRPANHFQAGQNRLQNPWFSGR